MHGCFDEAVQKRMSGNSTSPLSELSRIGLGYGIAIAVGILVLVTTIMLASYVCVRVHGQSQINHDYADAEAAVTTSGGGGGGVRVAVGSPRSEASAAPVAGLDEATLETYPKFQFGSKAKAALKDTACSICLSEYRDPELLRMLPDCGHVFHAGCIDAWLRMHATCPMCRASPLPSPQTTPLSTPLSQVVPLARHSSLSQR